jgi:mono/diheme cytochrome c family protein
VTPRTLASALVILGSFAAGAALASDWPSSYARPAERGADLYAKYCQTCHGERAAGDGPTARALVNGVPDFSRGFGEVDRDALVRSIVRGKGAMPAFEQALKQQKSWSGDVKEFAKAVLDHMDRLGRSAPPPRDEPSPPPDDEEGDAP